MATVVVGVDGSTGAVDALRFAAVEAALRKASLRVVSAWHLPMSGSALPFAPLPDPTDLEQSAEEVLNGALEAAAQQLEGVEVERVVRSGQPAGVLLEESEGADLLVVGSRGHGGFAGLLLGSVGQQVVHHARCPVVIVPHER